MRRSFQGLIVAGSCLLAALAMGPRGAAAQPDKDLVEEMVKNMAGCTSWGEVECMRICATAYQSFSDDPAGDQDAIAHCRALFPPAEARANAARAVAAKDQALKEEFSSKIAACRLSGRSGGTCTTACQAAYKDTGNRQLAAQCRAAHQRLEAAKAAAQPPEATMSLDARIAAMPEKESYCQGKLAQNTNTGIVRSLKKCALSCSGDRLKEAPEVRWDAAVRMCETLYHHHRGRLGD